MNATIRTQTDVYTALTREEGYEGDAVQAVIDSFIDADSRDLDAVGWADEDVEVPREQLDGTHTRYVDVRAGGRDDDWQTVFIDEIPASTPIDEPAREIIREFRTESGETGPGTYRVRLTTANGSEIWESDPESFDDGEA